LGRRDGVTVVKQRGTESEALRKLGRRQEAVGERLGRRADRAEKVERERKIKLSNAHNLRKR
jgi:hypothetical protein